MCMQKLQNPPNHSHIETFPKRYEIFSLTICPEAVIPISEDRGKCLASDPLDWASNYQCFLSVKSFWPVLKSAFDFNVGSPDWPCQFGSGQITGPPV